MECVATFLKNGNIYDGTNTPTQPPPYFGFLSFVVVVERICLLSVGETPSVCRLRL